MTNIIPNSNLPASSQPWGREIQKRLQSLESEVAKQKINNNSADAQLQSSYRRIDQTLDGLFGLGDAGSPYQINASNINAGTLNANVVSVTNLNASNLTSGTIASGRITSDSISAANVNADRINAGTLNGNVVSVTNLNAGNITSGTIASGRITSDSISAATISAGQITSGTISSDRISTSSLDAADINASRISAGTLTGSTVQTAASGARVRLSSGNNSFEVVNSSGAVTASISQNTGGMKISNITGDSQILLSTNQMLLTLGGGTYFQITGGGTTYLDSPGFGVNSLGTTTPSTYNVIHTENGSGFDKGRFTRIGLSGTGIRNVNVGGSGLLTTSTSDERLKQNIGPLDLGLNVIEKLQPKKFEFKDDPEIVEYGLIAQEVKEVLKSLNIEDNTNFVFEDNSEEKVSKLPEGESGPVLGVEYMKLIPILINSVKELQTRVQDLENRNEV